MPQCILQDACGDEVPVGGVEGRKVFEYRLDAAALERAVRARAR